MSREAMGGFEPQLENKPFRFQPGDVVKFYDGEDGQIKEGIVAGFDENGGEVRVTYAKKDGKVYRAKISREEILRMNPDK